MQVKLKRCKTCRKHFKPYRTTQVVCSWECAVADAKKKTEKKMKMKEQLEQRRQFLKLSKNLRWSIEATIQVVHEYVRERDKGKPCISCGSSWKESFQAGHYFKAELFSALKFDYERNIHGQCQGCNIYKEGNLNEYELNLPERIGQEEFEALKKDAEQSKKQDFKWDKEVLAEIRKEVKLKSKQLWK